MIVLYSLLLVTIAAGQAPIVKTSYGRIRGTQRRAQNGDVANIYKAVPLARAPIGPLRFALPREPRRWKGVRDGTQYSAACMSNSTFTSSPQQSVSEDCLYGNVFAGSNCTRSSPCPVIVYIHGGGYSYDSATMFDDQHIVDKFASQDVVFFIPAYRVGLFGFLHLEDSDDVVPRNLALYDIVHSLKWAQNEIRSFGGDPGRVTMMGHSSGAATVLFLAMSKALPSPSLGQPPLYHRVIAWSGLNTFIKGERLTNASMELARRVGCLPSSSSSSPSPRRLLACLRSIPASTLAVTCNAMDEERGGLNYNGIVLAPPIAFAGDTVADFAIAPENKVDALLGSTLAEFDVRPNTPPQDYGDFLGLRNRKEVSIKYFNDKPFFTHNHSYQSEEVYVSNYLYGASMSKAGGKVYLWQFDYPPRGYHAGDMYYGMGIHPFEMNDDDKAIDAVYSGYFVNFAKYGRPSSPDWTQFDPRLGNYWSIDSDVAKGVVPSMRSLYHADSVQYWLTDMLQFDNIVSYSNNQTMLKFPITNEMLKPPGDLDLPRPPIQAGPRNSEVVETYGSIHPDATEIEYNVNAVVFPVLLLLLAFGIVLLCRRHSMNNTYQRLEGDCDQRQRKGNVFNASIYQGFATKQI